MTPYSVLHHSSILSFVSSIRFSPLGFAALLYSNALLLLFRCSIDACRCSVSNFDFISPQKYRSFRELWNEGRNRIVFSPSLTGFSTTSHVSRLQPVTGQESLLKFFSTSPKGMS